MKQLMVLLVLVWLSAPVSAADVSGEWTFEISWERIGGTHTTVCTLRQQDRELAGSCWWGGRQFHLTGETDNSAVFWSFEIDENSTVAFDGRLDEDDISMRGRVSADRGGGPFTATRR